MRVVAGLEGRIIEGVANHDDIDTYAQAQLEIGQRIYAIDGQALGDAGNGRDEAHR